MVKKFFVFGIVFLLLGGIAFADLVNASATVGTTDRYSDNIAAGSSTTEGGNVTQVDLEANMSTEKWAGFYGNVTGSIVLAQGVLAKLFYQWTWSSSNGGIVCTTTTNSPTLTAAFQAASAAQINTVWEMGSDTDNATNTLNETKSLTFLAWGSISTNATGTYVKDANNDSVYSADRFSAAYLFNGATGNAKNDYVFCAPVYNGSWFGDNETQVDYQLMVPTNKTGGEYETYYFYVELH